MECSITANVEYMSCGALKTTNFRTSKNLIKW